ncbi:MAG: hypothetical protein M1829_001356 [Trizodia sp. TS-e1964]|nr:MAG: hypothetical protein M1829_001356 [Trizodia sp. TS-e1964]
MMLSSRGHNNIFLSALLLCPSLSLAFSLDCKYIRVDETSFNFEALGGPHTVSNSDNSTPPSNTTYTIDICDFLRPGSSEQKCPQGTRICGVETFFPEEREKGPETTAFPIAGDYIHKNWRLEPALTRLKTSKLETDKNKEGVRLELHGGRRPFNNDGKKQKAAIEFLCDPGRTGNEGNENTSRPQDGKDDNESERARKRAAKSDKNEKSIHVVKYDTSDDKDDVLHLEWFTKHACENESDVPTSSGHWGFFTWLVIIVFLGVASYLIFGSWLNYNRYNARGWDLLPHGDTIREVPYLMKDWGRRVVNTVQGGGSRGGYSAV